MTCPGLEKLSDGSLATGRRAGRLALVMCTLLPFEQLALSGHRIVAFAETPAWSSIAAIVACRIEVAQMAAAGAAGYTCSGRRVD